jgi:hypothetical protein
MPKKGLQVNKRIGNHVAGIEGMSYEEWKKPLFDKLVKSRFNARDG